MSKNWKSKVIKSQRGADGKWFAHKTAATFDNKQDAMAYAEAFADEQRASGVVGTRVNVLSRGRFKGEFGMTNNVHEFMV